MTTRTEDQGVSYSVVVNDDGQYSIWPTDAPVPAGWRETGVRGAKAECLARIKTAWTDMRPRSVRERLEPMREATAPPAECR
jgi:MbtH protein